MSQRRKASPAKNHSSGGSPARGQIVIALLVGAGLGLLSCGLCARFAELLAAARGVAGRFVLAGLFGGLAAGIALPRRLAASYAATLRQRLQPLAPTAAPRRAKPPESNPRELLWLVMAVLSMLAGVLVTLAPVAVHIVERIYRFAMVNFLWMVTPLTLLHLLVTLPLAGVIGVIIGVVAHCAHRLACPLGSWRIEPLGWMLVAAGAATAAVLVRCADARLAMACLVGAGLPFFGLAMGAVIATQRGKRIVKRRAPSVEPLPEQRDRLPGDLWVAMTVACAALVLGAQAWPDLHRSVDHRPAEAEPLGWLIGSVGAGVVIACRRWRGAVLATVRVGRIYAACGAGVMATTWLAGLAGTALIRGSLGSVIAFGAALIALALGGYALATCFLAVMSRAGSRSTGGAHGCAIICLCTATICLIVPNGWVERIGPMLLLSATALALIASGITICLRSGDRVWQTAAPLRVPAQISSNRSGPSRAPKRRSVAQRKRPAAKTRPVLRQT